MNKKETRLGVTARITVVLAVAMAAGCSRPGISDVEDDSHLTGEPVGLGLSIVDAEFWTNRTLRSDRINLESNDFQMLFVYLQESGLYVVTIEQTPRSTRGGTFFGNQLRFSGGRTEVIFQSTSSHIFSDRVNRDAWVEFIPGHSIADSPGAVVGLARDRSHIPGL